VIVVEDKPGDVFPWHFGKLFLKEVFEANEDDRGHWRRLDGRDHRQADDVLLELLGGRFSR
jgi:hypothetical protein